MAQSFLNIFPSVLKNLFSYDQVCVLLALSHNWRLHSPRSHRYIRYTVEILKVLHTGLKLYLKVSIYTLGIKFSCIKLLLPSASHYLPLLRTEQTGSQPEWMYFIREYRQTNEVLFGGKAALCARSRMYSSKAKCLISCLEPVGLCMVEILLIGCSDIGFL